MRTSFTHKVFIAILGMIVLILGGILFFFNRQTQSIAEEEVQRRLNQASRAFRNYQEEIRDKLFTVNAYISGNAYFIAYMAEAIDNNDTVSMLDQFQEIQRFSKCEFMIVTDPYGEPVVDTSDQIAEEAGENVIALMEAVDEGESPIAIFEAGGRLFTVVMSPIASGEYLNGYVLVGYQINDETAAKIGRVTNCDILLLSDQGDNPNHLVASFFGNSARRYTDRDLDRALKRAVEDQLFDMEIKGREYKGMMVQLKSTGGQVVGRYVTLKSLRQELAPFRAISNGLLIIGAFAILIISPLSIFAARGVTRPVNHLVSAIYKVREGEYDENQIQVSSSDEIGMMARAFKDMVKELREQRELIEFLESSGKTKDSVDLDQTVSIEETVAQQTPSMAAASLRLAIDSGDTLPSGFILGARYEILEVLGRGGMGVVYRARDRSLEEVIAIKMLHVNNPEVADLLKRETKLARMVTHRNIVRIYDLGELEDIQFITMEFVSGTTLKSLLKRVRRLPIPIGLRIANQVCRGLEAAHEAKVIHGDIKPDNVIINARGEIKIMDFGVSRVASLEAAGTNAVSGTPAYMPPEQFQGAPIDARADIYSLGIMMYEIFTGALPYSGKTLVELFKHHLATELPEMRSRNAQIPEELEEAIRTATKKRPDQRFDSVTKMRQHLRMLG